MDESAPGRANWVPVAAFLAAALVLGFVNLTGNLMTDDEGTYLYSAWRVSLGETPYRDFTLVQAPLSFWLMALVFKLFGPSVAAARIASYLCVVGAAGFIFAAGRRFLRLPGWPAAAAAGLFLFNKHVFHLGRTFMPDDLMLLFVAAAVTAALAAEERGAPARRTRSVAFLAGLSAGAAALSKLSGALVAAGYGAYLIGLAVVRKDERRSALGRLLLAAAGFLLAFGVPFGLLLAFVPGAWFDLVGFHAAQNSAGEAFSLVRPFERLFYFLGNHNYGPAAAALFGFALKPSGRDRRLLLGLLAAASAVFVFLPGRFFPRYLVPCLVPLAALAGAGLAEIWRRRRLRLAALPLLAALILLSLAPTFARGRFLLKDRGTPALAAFVAGHSAPGDYVFGDDPFINFLARRPCPPRLVDVSEAWTRSGLIRAEDVIRECEAFRVKILLLARGRSARHLSELDGLDRLRAYAGERFRAAGTIKREFLDVDVYVRPDGR